jgi:hypothetical protein
MMMVAQDEQSGTSYTDGRISLYHCYVPSRNHSDSLKLECILAHSDSLLATTSGDLVRCVILAVGLMESSLAPWNVPCECSTRRSFEGDSRSYRVSAF